MPYQIVVPKRVQREIDDLPTTVRSRVVQAIEHLKDEARPPGCSKLKGHRDEYRIRVGDYRVRYEIRDAESVILLLHCGHRKDVYR
jgi:mRNA interferase RelE/StbE